MQPASSIPAQKSIRISSATKHSQDPANRNRWIWLVIGFLALLSVSGILATFGVGYFRYYQTLILPGVRFRDANLAGLTQSQAAVQLNDTWNVQHRLELTDGVRNWETTPAFLGLWLDVNKMAEQAYQTGRDAGWTAEITGRRNVVPVEITPVIQFNQQVAKDNLTKWAETLSVPAQDASLEYVQGKVTVHPAVEGTRLDLQKTIANITADPASALLDGKVQVSFQPILPDVTDVSAAVTEIERLQALKLSGLIYDPILNSTTPWEVPSQEQAAWITVKQNDNGNYQVTLDETQLEAYLAELDTHVQLDAGLELEPVSDPPNLAKAILAGEQPILMVRHKPYEYVTQSSQALISIAWKVGVPMWRLMKANPGVNEKYIPAGTRLTIPSLNDLLPEPVVLNKRIVVSITDQHMWVYQDGKQIRDFVVSTGIADSPTQPGVYQVQTHELNAYAEQWNLWLPHWLGIYEAWPGFMNGIHGLPMLSNGVRLWKNVLGKPASFGCIILDLPNAEWLYGWAENGVVVEIQP